MAEQNLKPYKMLVFSMAILLIGGVLLLTTGMVSGFSLAKCRDGKLGLPANSNVLNMNVSDKFVTFTLNLAPKDKPADLRILRYDACSGKLLNTLMPAAAQ